MNIKQQAAVKWLQEEILTHDGSTANPADYEYKRFEVEDCGAFVSVVSEVGLVGDEGTAASILCRTRRHIHIGKRGGMRLMNTAHWNPKFQKMVSCKPVTGRKVVYWTVS